MKFLTLASSLLAAVSGQYLGYAGYPYAAHAIVGLKSAPCVNAANVPVPCAAGYYGKRDAEADPQLLVAGVPFGSSTGLDPITQGLDAVTQGVVTKRSADADAAVLYGAYGYPYAHAYVPFGSSSGLDPITQGLDPVTQGYVPYYGYGHYAWGK